ncbi:MAG TPA: universal stress protein [Terriglobales bacterium]|nr:universal stress protein [Terriglobales bacterium]
MHTVEAGRRIALKSILFATDFSPCSNAALPYALSVARRYGARLHAAHVMPTKAEMLFMSPESWPEVAEEEDKRIQACIEQLEKQFQGLPHDMLTPTGKVADALAQIIEEREIDLLVLGTHGRAGVGKLFLGSVAEETIRRAACPVLSVGPNVSSKPDGEIQFQHIVFATDFSEDSLAALPYAVSLAEEDQAQLALLHVIEQPAAGIADLEEVKASLMRRLKELVPPEAEPWCHAECLLEFGRQFAPPAERILEVAGDQAADLIVLGVRPVHGKLGLVTHLASTTAQILTQAACPVFTVRGGYAK